MRCRSLWEKLILTTFNKFPSERLKSEAPANKERFKGLEDVPKVVPPKLRTNAGLGWSGGGYGARGGAAEGGPPSAQPLHPPGAAAGGIVAAGLFCKEKLVVRLKN